MKTILFMFKVDGIIELIVSDTEEKAWIEIKKMFPDDEIELMGGIR